MPVFPAIFECVAGNLLSVDGSATQLPAILLAILPGVDAPLKAYSLHIYTWVPGTILVPGTEPFWFL